MYTHESYVFEVRFANSFIVQARLIGNVRGEFRSVVGVFLRVNEAMMLQLSRQELFVRA